MTLVNPVWLLLAIPLAISMWFLKPPSRGLQIFRVIILTLVILAMCSVSIKLPSKKGTLVVIADRSKSMPADAAAKQKETIDLIISAMSAGDDLAVVSFGQSAVIERPPQAGKFPGFTADVGSDASNLADALNLANSLIPRQSTGRILLLSDGRFTGPDPLVPAAAAANRRISIDYRLTERPANNDLAVYRLDVPDKVDPGQSFMITAWVHSPLNQQISCQLTRGNTVISSANTTVSSGLTRLTFRDKASSPGTIQYKFSLAANPDDPVPENNTARVLLGVEGQKPMLCVSQTPSSSLARLLKNSQMQITSASPQQCTWDLEDLSNYSSVLLEDVPANKIGKNGMENIAAWVTQTGSGFMMTGGKSAYGPGGYFKSPLEPIMPVSMELRKEHRKFSLAIVVALDRSGSMAAPVAGGKTKMDLANIATAQVLDMLSPVDEFGVIAVDSTPHTICDIAPVEKNQMYRSQILSIQSMGGGIFVYNALESAAQMLTSATPQTRHIILFADAADAEQPGKYKQLLEKCSQAGVTVSVIGLGTEFDSDADFLKDVAARGNGRCFFTESPEELPRLFAQDTFVVARSSFLEEPTNVKLTGGLVSLAGRQFDLTKTIGGYNLCYIRPKANLAAVTLDEYSAPVVASWQAGTGRALCYTGQADGTYTGDIANWPQVGSFFSSLARWTAGQTSNLGPDMLLTQKVENGTCILNLYLDPERTDQPIDDLPEVTTLHALPGKKPAAQKANMHFSDADTLTLEVPITGSETSLSTVEVPGHSPITLPPACLPYSPEFKPAQNTKGPQTLSNLAKTTAGKDRVNLSSIWDDLPRQTRMIPIGSWLLIAAVVLLLCEVLQRRTALFSAAKFKKLLAISQLSKLKISFVKSPKKVKLPKAKKLKTKLSPQPEKQKPAAPEKKKETKTPPDLFSAMSKARRSAKNRTDKK